MKTLSNKFYALFCSVFFLFAGFGLFLNSAGVKLAQMGVNSTAIGALNAAFFVGAALSAVAAHRVVSGVGHIRAFSVFGAVFAMAALGHMMTDKLWAWGVLRVGLGFCYYSLLMIVESWFAERSAAGERARVLAFYNVVYYVAFTVGIALLSLKPSSNDIFTLAAILVMAAMLPVALTRMSAPQLPPRQRISIPRLMAIAPLALVGSFVGGLLMNGFFTMASVFLLQQGFGVRQISFYLMVAMITGFAVQLPVARFSDRYGRRNAILACAVIAAVGAVAGLVLMLLDVGGVWAQYGVSGFFGVGLFTLYALSVARANDQLPNEMNTVEVSRSLLFSYGMGSLLAPLLLGAVMQQAQRYGFYTFFAVGAALLAWVAWRQQVVPEAKRSVHVAMSGDTGPLMADLDPRNNEGVMRPFDEVAAQQYADELAQEEADKPA
ncbi:MFS transporter [Uruburuella testudinis]|uniref:MFS transporter n=1 Tax=Uruburuella testudinis TaxID=1282863 RepID=A0ABY4DU23_9NEIS|nr:MFS transporter [Uruburuella testudinis]UOO81928.1 MFS transporter [Uruburuella testudinis]